MKDEVCLNPLPSQVSKPSVPLPQDEALAGLPLLFDLEAVRERLNSEGASVEGGQVFYLRYKPKTSCIAAYEFERLDPATGERKPAVYYGKGMTTNAYLMAATKAENHRWIEVAPGYPIMRFDEARALLYTFPNDAVLDGLRILEEPKKLQRFLYEHFSSYPSDKWRLSDKRLATELVRYKPERRAVFRSRTKAVHRESEEKEKVEVYWRVYGENQGAEVFRRMEFLKGNLSEKAILTVPVPFGYEPERQILLMEALPGRPLLELLSTNQAETAVAKTAAALAHLHTLSNTQLPVWRVEDFLAEAAETAKMLSALLPERTAWIEELLKKLQSGGPESQLSFSFVHGDFYYGQIIAAADKIGFIDFDRSHTGEPLADAGNFLAHLKLLQLERRLPQSETLAEAFVDTYADAGEMKPEQSELNWWTALSLFFLSVGPFRRLEAGWPEQTGCILSTVEELLC